MSVLKKVQPASLLQKLSLTRLDAHDIAEIVEGMIHYSTRKSLLEACPEKEQDETKVRTDILKELCGLIGTTPENFDPLAVFENMQEFQQANIEVREVFRKRIAAVENIKNPEKRNSAVEDLNEKIITYWKNETPKILRRITLRKKGSTEQRINDINVMREGQRAWLTHDYIPGSPEDLKTDISQKLKKAGPISITSKFWDGENHVIPDSDIDLPGTRRLFAFSLTGDLELKSDFDFAELLQLSRITSAQGLNHDEQKTAILKGIDVFARQDARDGGDELLRRRRYGQRERAFHLLKEPQVTISLLTEPEWNLRAVQDFAGFAMSKLAEQQPDFETVPVKTLREHVKREFGERFGIDPASISSFDLAVMVIEKLVAEKGSIRDFAAKDPTFDTAIVSAIKTVRAMSSDDEKLAFLNKRRKVLASQEQEYLQSEAKTGTTR